jgi:hypothetical protein
MASDGLPKVGVDDTVFFLFLWDLVLVLVSIM